MQDRVETRLIKNPSYIEIRRIENPSYFLSLEVGGPEFHQFSTIGVGRAHG